VLLGDGRTRLLYRRWVACRCWSALPWPHRDQPLAALGLIAALLLVQPVRRIRGGAAGLTLIPCCCVTPGWPCCCGLW